MRTYTIIPVLSKIANSSNHRWAVFEIPDDSIEAWCLELCLLREGLIERVRLTDRRNQPSVEIVRSGDQHYSACSCSETAWEIQIGVDPLEYAIAFFLEYYRDEAASVDHIDIEADHREGDEDSLMIVLKVANARPPLSSEELRSKLGLSD